MKLELNYKKNICLAVFFFFVERRVFNTLKSTPAVLNYLENHFGITMNKDFENG